MEGYCSNQMRDDDERQGKHGQIQTMERELTKFAYGLGSGMEEKVKDDSTTFDVSNWEGLSCHLLIVGRLQGKKFGRERLV